jgi:hypothetical protein
MTGMAVVIVLTALLIVANLNCMAKERRISSKQFYERIGRLDLTKREREILEDVATRAKLRQNESVFTIPAAFVVSNERNDSRHERSVL